jgi:DNA-binding response OmpR family regulator
MKSTDRSKHILVISQSPELAELTRKAADEAIAVDYAANRAEGLSKLTETHPDIIVLGPLDSQQSVLALYCELREGWISRHASLIIAEFNAAQKAFRLLGDENLDMSIGNHVFLVGVASPFLPIENYSPI